MRLGMLSAAHVHADSYVQNLRAVPDVELIGVADDDAERGKQFTAQYNTRYFPAFQDLLREAPDGVVICSENSRHRELVEMTLAAGIKSILCEKPLTTTLEDGRALLQAVDRAGARLMTAFPMRFNTPILEAKKLIDAGKLGKLLGCNATNQGHNPSHARAWFVDKRLAGGGAVMDHTVHVVDVMRWIMGSEIVELYAESDNLFPEPGVDIDTAGALLITFANGVFLGLDCSWSRPAYYPTWGNVKIEFVGERGLVVADAFAQKFTTYSAAVGRGAWDYWGSDSDQLMVNEFAASIREQRQPSITGADGYKATEAVVAAYLSSQTHQPVHLPLE